ncbi:MAG: tetratricopeptide repeat protein, partial [Pyrinomonadaceae bacterium]
EGALPEPSASPLVRLSDLFAQNLQRQTTDVSRERREQAYAKLLEGQRYLWSRQRARSQANVKTAVELARKSIQSAIELDPKLSEAYTVLSELSLLAPPYDADEAIKLAVIGIGLNKDNFGARRILARLYTLKSGIGKSEGNLSSPTQNNTLNAEFTQKAIMEWRELIRLDSRYSEAWAFLAAFYEEQGKKQDRIDALNNWLASATPLETGFYKNVFGNQENLSPENATLKLGAALVEDNRTKEAVEILSRAIADDPENAEAVELLREALQTADSETASIAVQALRQAVYANSENIALIKLLAEIQFRSGHFDDGAKTLRDNILKLTEKDKNAAANLQIVLGDNYADNEKYDEAVAIYQNSLKIRGIIDNQLITDEDRDFAIAVYSKMLHAYKSSGKVNEAKSLIEQTRPIFGKSDLFADRQLIELYRESGKNDDALKVVQAMRVKNPAEYSLMRIEASILTDLGRVDEGVAIIQSLIGKTSTVPSVMTDDFINYLYISSLYSQGKRGKAAIETANKAYSLAQDDERKQIAKLTLATAQQMSGDYVSAENTLREILKQTPRNPIALNNLGYFLVERNEKLNEALDLIKQAVKIDPTNPSYLDSLGWAYFRLGKFTEAETSLKEAAKYDASSATIHEHLGDAYQKLDKKDSAKKAWQKALMLTSDAEEVSRLKTKLSK